MSDEDFEPDIKSIKELRAEDRRMTDEQRWDFENHYRMAYRDGWIECVNTLVELQDRGLSGRALYLKLFDHWDGPLAVWDSRSGDIHAEPPRVKISRYGFSRATRQFIYERDKGICGICHRYVEADAFEIDHIVALANGGSGDYSNLQLAHVRCNRQKWMS